jgi:hypothetical protein
MVYERGGVGAVKTLLASGPTSEQLRAALEQLLGKPWLEIATQWRARVLAFGAALGRVRP